MVGLAKLAAIVMAVAGIVIMLKPETARDLQSFWKEGNRIYFLGAIRIIVGTVFILAASDCMVPWIVMTMGIIAVAAGALTFIIGLEKSKKMLERWQEKPKVFYRKVSFVPIAFGLLLLWAI
ncbi:MAG: hypothetical protein GF408_07165 [Candidatus Omnitrophica bacterium]|nr:hypothetical protein [Candidatus Omnitrophota bacterium]